MDELVSVLIPLYNHEQYVNECLESIKNQTYNNLEIILINDGSNDNSEEVVHKWIANNPMIDITYILQENQGVTKTLNNMIGLAKGRYLTFCASDDMLQKKSIEERVEFLKTNLSFKACIGDACVIDTHSELINESAMKVLYRANYQRLQNNIVEELVLNWSFVGSTLLVQKDLFDFVGLFDEKLIIEDREFFLRLLSNNILGFLPSRVAYYRIHTSNISRKNRNAKWNIYNQIAISNLKHADIFKGINKIFLKSYIVDKYFTDLEYGFIKYYIFNIFRVVRRVFFYKILTTISTKG